MLYWHRLIALIGTILLIYVIVTGLGTQLADMRALVTNAPATDPDMMMMRQHIYGTPSFAVKSPQDYTAAPLPAGFDYAAALAKTAALGRAAAPAVPLRLVEVRTVGGTIAGHVQAGEDHMIFDLASGRRLPQADVPRSMSNDVPGSLRHTFKKLHQMRWAAGFGAFFSGIAGLMLSGLILTGLWHYFRLFRARRRMGRKAILWRGGGTWRELHRMVAVGGAVILIWIAGTGVVMSIDDIGGSIRRMTRPAPPAQAGPQRPDARGGRGGGGQDVSSPLKDQELPGMARVTLAAFGRDMPDTGVRALRLRYYAGYRQGVVIAADDAASQMVYNTTTGAAMAMQEPGYPDSGFPYGWEWHQCVKRLHRGDFFGMTGRWLSTLGGLALLYLVVSGPIMYWQVWRRRRANGRGAILWG